MKPILLSVRVRERMEEMDVGSLQLTFGYFLFSISCRYIDTKKNMFDVHTCSCDAGTVARCGPTTRALQRHLYVLRHFVCCFVRGLQAALIFVRVNLHTVFSPVSSAAVSRIYTDTAGLSEEIGNAALRCAFAFSVSLALPTSLAHLSKHKQGDVGK